MVPPCAATTPRAITTTTDTKAKLLQQIMQLMRAYNIGNDSGSSPLSTLSVSA